MDVHVYVLQLALCFLERVCMCGCVCMTYFHAAEAFSSLIQDTGRLDVLTLLLPG